MTYAAIHKLFIGSWFGNFDQNAARFSVATIRNACVADHFSRKVTEVRSCRCNPVDQARFLRAIEHFPSCNFVSIDGLKVSHKDYNARRGYARTSKRAIRRQFTIRAMDYAVMIACTVSGIIAYQIFDGNVGAEEIVYFIDHVLAPKITTNQCAILDNAHNQNNQAVRARLDAAFGGLYCFLSEYSPEFAPVETINSNVKSHVRDHEVDIHKTELQLLTDALDYYSVGHDGGSTAENQFNVYKNNHDAFLHECAARAAVIHG